MARPALVLLHLNAASAAVSASAATAKGTESHERDTGSLLQVSAVIEQELVKVPAKPWPSESGRVGWGWDPLDSEANTNVIMPVRTRQVKSTEHHGQRHYDQRSQLIQAGCLVGYLFFFVVTVVTYWSQGARIIVYVLAYLVSLATMTISVKHIYTEFEFKFPKILTALHLFFSAVLGFVVLIFRAAVSGQWVAVPSPWEFLSRVFPISFCFGLAVGLNNMGLIYLSPVLAEILGALNPLVSVPLTYIVGMPFHMLLLLPIAIVVGGVVVAVQPWEGLARDDGPGMVCVFLAVVLRSVKSVLQQETMTGVLCAKFDEYVLLAWSCATSSAIMFAWSALEERGRPYCMLAQSDQRTWLSLELMLSVIIAMVVNLSHLWVTKALGAVSSQLLGQTKTPLILLGSVGFLGDRLDHWERAGFAMVLVGSFLYGAMQNKLLPVGTPKMLVKWSASSPASSAATSPASRTASSPGADMKRTFTH